MTDLTKEKIELLKELLANAPEGATHSGLGLYLKDCDSYYEYFCPEYGWQGTEQLSDFQDVRSLDDIRLIVFLFEDNERLKNEVWVYAAMGKDV